MLQFTVKRTLDDELQERSEEYVDVSLVNEAVQDEAWWTYGVILQCVGGVTCDLQLFSRSCDCHKAAELELDNIDTYYRRAKAVAKEAGSASFKCPAKGMHCKNFAVFEADKLCKRRFSDIKFKLLSKCKRLSAARTRIMGDLTPQLNSLCM